MTSRVLVLSLLLCSMIPVSTAAAQERATASMLQTHRSEGVDEGTAGAFDRMLRQRLDELDVVTVSGQVVLDLEQVQIALGCMGETVQCLEAVTGELGVQILLVPSIDRAEDQIVASVLLFDARDRAQRRVSRTAAGSAALLQEVEPMLRELFGLPPRATGGGLEAGGEQTPVTPARAGLSPWPVVLIGVGAAALVGGAIAGALSADDASAFRSFQPGAGTTTADVDAMYERLDRADAEALAANVLFVAGGVIAGAGLIWLLAAGNEDGSSPIAAAPVIGPDGVGIVLAGSFGGGAN